jgi:hypothetical protein
LIGYDSHRSANSLHFARIHHFAKIDDAIQFHRVQAAEIGQQSESGAHFGKQSSNFVNARSHLSGGHIPQMSYLNNITGYITHYLALGLLVHSSD